MSGDGTNTERPLVHEHVGRHGNRSGGVYHVVQNNDVTTLHFSDSRHLTDDIRFLSLLVTDNHRCAKVFGVCAGTFGSAHVGSGYRKVLYVERFDVRYENSARIEMVYRNIEKSLNLVGVQVHGHDSVHTGGTQQIGHEFGPYRYPRTVLAVLTRPTEIRHNRYDPVRRCPVRRIYHKQQLHEILGRRESRLHDKHRTSADTLVESRLKFSVAEFEHCRVSDFGAVCGCYFLGQRSGIAACEDFKFVCRHIFVVFVSRKFSCPKSSIICAPLFCFGR